MRYKINSISDLKNKYFKPGDIITLDKKLKITDSCFSKTKNNNCNWIYIGETKKNNKRYRLMYVLQYEIFPYNA